MPHPILTMDHSSIDQFTTTEQQRVVTALEQGQVIHFPAYFFTMSPLAAQNLLSETILDGKHKNISYDFALKRLGGYQKNHDNPALAHQLQDFMHAYAAFAHTLVERLFPIYTDALQWGRTSYRPAQILGRPTSKRKDDTRLHVDAFAATPVHGKRILRIFCNVNPYGEPRVWHLGESFAAVYHRFAHSLPSYKPHLARLLHMLKVTKTRRQAYDHYQLHLHDTMKQDEEYQRHVPKFEMPFPALSTWIVYTDSVSHAALSGQFLLEQTFYLPVSAMANPELSPLHYWNTHAREKSKAKTEESVV